jgi:hypothetical protein
MAITTIRREHYERFQHDVLACVQERRSHPACSKGASLEFYATSWGREIDPGFFEAIVLLLERHERAAR